MKICFLGLFETDPIITGGTGGETKPPPKRTGPCVDPGQGKPAYDQVVLSTLHGEGEISRADYQAVRAGTRSIEELNLTPEQLQRLRCSEAPSATGTDRHFDPAFPPQLIEIAKGQQVTFSPQHKPTDKAHRLTITTDAAAGMAAGAWVCRVNFGTEYVQEHRVPAAPLVMVTGAGGQSFWRAANITASGYDLYTDSGVKEATTATVQVLVEPTRR